MKTPKPYYPCAACDEDDCMYPPDELFWVDTVATADGEWLCKDCLDYSQVADADKPNLPRLDRELKQRSEHEFNERCNLAINAAQGIFPKSGG